MNIKQNIILLLIILFIVGTIAFIFTIDERKIPTNNLSNDNVLTIIKQTSFMIIYSLKYSNNEYIIVNNHNGITITKHK